jgi:hypothetical protein
MSDQVLLVFGCAVSFIALGGAYVAVRERFRHRVPHDVAGLAVPAAGSAR